MFCNVFSPISNIFFNIFDIQINDTKCLFVNVILNTNKTKTHFINKIKIIISIG